MEINLGDELIVALQPTYSSEQIKGMAAAKRVDAFGQMAKLLQRPKPEDIEITTLQTRLEPFWYAVAQARYVYDRRHAYRVPVSPEVKSVTIADGEQSISGGAFALEGIEHCEEELRKELMLDAVSGQEVNFSKYLTYPKNNVAGIADLQQEGILVITPEVKGSFVVRKLFPLLMKTFQADKIHEEKIDVEQVTLFYRPIYAVEFLWKAKQKTQVVEFDGLTGEAKAEGGAIKKQVARVLDNDALFDIGADVVGTVVPGANIAVKLGRIGAKKLVK